MAVELARAQYTDKAVLLPDVWVAINVNPAALVNESVVPPLCSTKSKATSSMACAGHATGKSVVPVITAVPAA